MIIKTPSMPTVTPIKRLFFRGDFGKNFNLMKKAQTDIMETGELNPPRTSL